MIDTEDDLCERCVYAVWEDPPKEFRFFFRPCVAGCQLGFSPYYDEIEETNDCIGFKSIGWEDI